METIVPPVTTPGLTPGTDNGGETDTVQSSERMVGGEDIAPFGRDVFLMYQIEGKVKIADKLTHEIYSFLIVVTG